MLLYSQITGGSVAKLSSNVIKQDIVDYLHNKVGLSKKELSGFVDDRVTNSNQIRDWRSAAGRCDAE